MSCRSHSKQKPESKLASIEKLTTSTFKTIGILGRSSEILVVITKRQASGDSSSMVSSKLPLGIATTYYLPRLQAKLPMLWYISFSVAIITKSSSSCDM
ncbi:hypothetical protein GE21DRAFT_1356302, partial [Neurospora crassa]